ncbi:PREDICTED: kinesin-like protein KIF6 [Acanthisitta chloris]|uniref:kinesin-like protein KIF6 n=1 Tax=Acanthisitta chloris TaxID=57068 RepID=UPI0004F0FB06|nr:PREDICTED: kinesin-like protein KIF6 [Acanthisitta chloris]
MSLGCEEAFEIFKQDHADSIITIEGNKQLLKQRFAEAKCVGEKINEVRNKINHLKAELTQRHIQRAAVVVFEMSSSSGVFVKVRCSRALQSIDFIPRVTSSEVIAIRKKNHGFGAAARQAVMIALPQYLRFLLSYKTMSSRFKGLKVEIEHVQLLMEKEKMKLRKDFEVWWSEKAKNLQQEKTERVSSPDTATAYLQFIKSSQHLSANRNINSSANNERTTAELEKQEFANPAIYWKNPKTDFSETTRISLNEDPARENNSISSSSPTLRTRTPQIASSSIPLTGDSQTDADILAFIKARQSILQKKGDPPVKGRSETVERIWETSLGKQM